MKKKLKLISLLLFGFVPCTIFGVNPGYATEHEELEARVKELESVVLGHKRHPKHPLTDLNITGGMTGVVQGSPDVTRWDEGDAGWDTDASTHATGSIDLVFEFPIADNHMASLFLEAGAGDGLQAAIEEGINRGVIEMLLNSMGDDEFAEIADKLETSVEEARDTRRGELGEELEFGRLLHGINDDAIGFGNSGESDVHVLEAWFEGSYFNGLFTLTMGKVDLTNYLEASAVANDETAQFLSSGFVNNLAIDFPDENGPGVRLSIDPTDFMEINLGVADARGGWDNIFDNGFGMLELNIKPRIGEYEGNYRFYGWLSDKDYENFDSGQQESYGTGFGISADQQLPGGLTIFARVGMMDDDIYAVEAAWSAGAQLSGVLWGRDDDVIACAYGEALLNDNHPDWQELEALDIATDNEQQFEAYYSLSVNENTTISPDVQLVMNPAGIAGLDDIWVFGARAQINFF